MNNTRSWARPTDARSSFKVGQPAALDRVHSRASEGGTVISQHRDPSRQGVLVLLYQLFPPLLELLGDQHLP